MKGKMVFSNVEAREKILERKDTFLLPVDLKGKTIVGDLDIYGETIERFVDLANTTVKGDLNFGNTTFKRGLSLSGAIVEGILNAGGMIFKKVIDLSTKEGPKKIWVDQKNAQMMHWAAPNIPLVIRKE